MTPSFATLGEQYLALRRRLGYKLDRQAFYVRGFARFLDDGGHRGPVPRELSIRWATSTTADDPRNPARRLVVVCGYLRHLAAFDGATEVPPPGVLGPTQHRKPPHVYSDREIACLLRAAANLRPRGGLRPHCYHTLFALLACTGLRISEALTLTRKDVDLSDGVLTVRLGKGGRMRLVPLHPSALAPLRRYGRRRDRWPGSQAHGAFFRTERADRLAYPAVACTFRRLRRRLGWTAQGRARTPRIHDLRHRVAVERLRLWHAGGVDMERKIPALATYLGHAGVSDVYWYLTAVPELMAVVGQRFERATRSEQRGGV